MDESEKERLTVLLSCQNLTKSFGVKELFRDISLGIAERDRLAIIGPNGSGKSSLLKILAGELEPDSGSVTRMRGLRSVYVAQQTHFDGSLTVSQVVENCAIDHDAKEAVARNWLGRLGFTQFDQRVSELSGGWRKRLSFACAFVQEPQLLFLDEPTNHLDLEGIEWLEKNLNNANFAWVLVTHDRHFLANLAKRIIEVNRVYRGGMFEVSGGYTEFLTAKAEFISGQQQQQESLANKVRREVEWLRRGPKARTTKQQARIQGADELQDELNELSGRLRTTKVELEFNASGRKTKKLAQLTGVSKSFDQRYVIKNFSYNLMQGTKLGLLGLNASGKSTLLRLIAGQSAPTTGEIKFADDLKVVYFEQNRDRLDLESSLKRNLAPDSDSVVFNDRAIHVVTWARKFNFLPDQLDTPVGKLSGGEQARLLIAKLILEPADILLLDEPTNDLDIPTLEVLEESLLDFKGAIVLVTHDRYMLDRVSNALLALDGEGRIGEFADYAQWQAHQRQKVKQSTKQALKQATVDVATPSPTTEVKKAKKLSYMEQRELDLMEQTIATAESNLTACREFSERSDVVSHPTKAQDAYAALAAAEAEVERLYNRWAELEQKTQG